MKKLIEIDNDMVFDVELEWKKFKELISSNIEQKLTAVENKGQYLYYVNPRSTKKLHQLFIENIPTENRQYFTCNTCFTFINKIGPLVTIGSDGVLHSVCWEFTDNEKVPELFAKASKELKEAVEHGTIRTIFCKENSLVSIDAYDYMTLGIPITGEWDHLSATIIPCLSMNVPDKRITEDEFRQILKVCKTTLDNIDKSSVKKAIGYAIAGKFIDSSKVGSKCQSILNILDIYEKTHNRNLAIRLIFDNRHILYHLGSSSLGELLKNFKDGIMDDEYNIGRYNYMTDPAHYKRATSAPTEALIKEAENVISELGAENSLKRRFALVSDLPNLLWVPVEKDESDIKRDWNGIFSKIKSKEDLKNEYNPIKTRGGNITLHKFLNSVVQYANKIYVHCPRHVSDYSAYTTAEYMDSPCIIKWDHEEQRNPISMYMYRDGSTPDIWNITPGDVECVGIANYPKDLYSNTASDKGVLFILKGAKDTYNRSSAIFVDNLIPEFYPIRKVIEAYSESTPLLESEGQLASGLYYNGGTMEVTVYTDYAIMTYTIDRKE